jgi:hypothetical protein
MDSQPLCFIRPLALQSGRRPSALNKTLVDLEYGRMKTEDETRNRKNAALFFILEHFPQHSEKKIQQLFQENDSFQSLCEDYRVCAKALKYWRHSTSDKAPARREEYADLLKELEAEVLLYLSKIEYKR